MKKTVSTTKQDIKVPQITKATNGISSAQDHKDRTKLMIRMFQLRALQESLEIPLRKQILLTPNLNNTIEDGDGLNGWENANLQAWNHYANLMELIEDNEDQNAILFNKIITPAV